MRVQKILPLFVISLALTACGGGSGGGGSKSSSSKPVSSSKAASSSIATSSSAATVSSSLSLSSVTTSSSSVDTGGDPIPSSSSSSDSSATESSSSSSSIAVIIIDMTDGWRGNSSGNTANSGISYNADGLTFTAAGAGVGAVFDVLKPTQLEGAVVEMVVNVSSEFKSSGANLQIFAQLKNDWGKGEWNCLSYNIDLKADTDTTLTCTIDESDRKFNQSTNDVQMGIQATGTPSGTVTIKSAKITLAPPGSISSASSSSSSSFSYPSYEANVASLKDLADFPIGAAVGNTDSPSTNIVTNTMEQALVEKHFSQMTAGNIMKMSYLHPRNNGTADDYDFTNADAFVAYAKSKGMSVHAHTMFWHSGYQVPDFMKNWTGTSAEFLTTVDSHVTSLVDHFEVSGNVKSWDVVNEALTDDNPSDYRKDSPFYIASGNSPEFIERAFKAARAANADVELYYNDYSTENNGPKTDMLVKMIDDLQAKSTPITGIGFQMHLYLDYPSIANIKAAMQKVVDRNLKVKITELDVSINNPFSNGWSLSTATPYDGLAQKKRYCEIIKAYKDTVPEELRGGVTVWGTTDASTWLDSFYRQQGKTNGEAVSWPLLFTPQYGDKPALRGFADALQDTACTNL